MYCLFSIFYFDDFFRRFISCDEKNIFNYIFRNHNTLHYIFVIIVLFHYRVIIINYGPYSCVKYYKNIVFVNHLKFNINILLPEKDKLQNK